MIRNASLDILRQESLISAATSRDVCSVACSLLTGRSGASLSVHFLTLWHSNREPFLLRIRLSTADFLLQPPSCARESGYSNEVLPCQSYVRFLRLCAESTQGSSCDEYVRVRAQVPPGCESGSIRARCQSRDNGRFIRCGDPRATSFHDSDVHTAGPKRYGPNHTISCDCCTNTT